MFGGGWAMKKQHQSSTWSLAERNHRKVLGRAWGEPAVACHRCVDLREYQQGLAEATGEALVGKSLPLNCQENHQPLFQGERFNSEERHITNRSAQRRTMPGSRQWGGETQRCGRARNSYSEPTFRWIPATFSSHLTRSFAWQKLFETTGPKPTKRVKPKGEAVR